MSLISPFPPVARNNGDAFRDDLAACCEAPLPSFTVDAEGTDWHEWEPVSDRARIAAMAAKNVQPAPQPVHRIAGIEVTEDELAAALAAVRAMRVPPESSPRGLSVVAGFDHRLGAWRG